MTRRVALAATSQVSLAAGELIARAGGNAVDVCMAAAMTTMSTEPGITSLGGGGYVSIWAPGRDPFVIDGNVEMPGRGLPRDRFGQGLREYTTDYGGGVTMYVGHGSVATPGAIGLCQNAVEESGSLPWADVVAPAADAARTGYPMAPAGATYLSHTGRGLFGPDPDAYRLVSGPTGDPLKAGEMSRNPELAEVLELIARDGSSVMSTGEVGRAMADDMARHGGLVTRRDLAEYAPLVRTPLRRSVGEWDIAVNPPPSVGGPMLAVMLGEMAKCGDWHWPDIIEIQRAVLQYRRDVHDVSPDLDAAGHALLLAVDRHGLAGLPTSSSTANLSAVDSDGLACAITVSTGYAAGITIPGTGILLNNALGEVELNRLGLHVLAPGTRLASNMAPTTGRTADGRVLAIGSPGADRITTALMQVLGQGCLHGADLEAAILAPRVHVHFREDGRPVVMHESDPAISAAVEALGLDGVDFGVLQMYFGGVGAGYRATDGGLEAAGDPRRAAAVGVF